MKAKVICENCIGCGICEGIEPDVFRMNDDGIAEAYQEATEANKSKVEDAINSCPGAAIEWED